MRRPILPESMNTRVSFNNTAKGASKPLFRNLLRRQPYMIIVTLALVVLLQAVFLPWFFFPQTKTTDDLVISPPGRATTKQHSTAAADGASFNNYPIYLQQDKPFHSTVHCVGETHHEDTAWMHRSCHFNYLCFDTSSKEFLVVESPYEQKFQQRRVPNVFVSTELSSRNPNSTSLALGGINPRWKGNDFNQGIEKVRWFPKRLKEPPKEYYLLDPSVVLVPFHSFAAHNVGHMLWDDFLPIYTLLQIFDFIQSSSYNHLLLRVDTLPLLYGTCEMRRKKVKTCAANFEKFLPLLGIDPKTFFTAKTVQFTPSPSAEATSTMVCSRHATAGLGMLTDHGLKDHGWLPSNEHSVQNVAKGPLLYQFRNYMLRNLGIPTVPPPSDKLKIIFSAHSSQEGERDVGFESQQSNLQTAFPTANVATVQLSEMGMREQVELMSSTNVFVSTCGGGSMTATFLPRGATVIMYYAENGGFEFSSFNLTGGPAYLDWDLFNNAAYLRVHWLPIGSMNTKEGAETLMYLIHHETDVTSNGM